MALSTTDAHRETPTERDVLLRAAASVGLSSTKSDLQRAETHAPSGSESPGRRPPTKAGCFDSWGVIAFAQLGSQVCDHPGSKSNVQDLHQPLQALLQSLGLNAQGAGVN
jgi:hypothetical protein